MKDTFSLHKITDDKRFTFSAKKYSKFKFGSKSVSREFGYTLGKSFCEEVLPHLHGPFVVLSSPYCFIPTATFAMKDYFVRIVNNYLVENNLPVLEEAKIHRTITYKEDYGELSKEERFALIQNDGFHIDVEFIRNKTLILLDDVKITGSHERVIERMLAENHLDNDRVYVYFGELVNPEVDPKVENVLNYAFVKNLLDLDKIIKNDEFILNTRIVKYILNSKEEEVIPFLNYQKLELLKSIYHLAIGNSYHTIPEYKKNLTYLKNLINDAVGIVSDFRSHSFGSRFGNI